MDPKDRFSTRVENYVKYRPGYPSGVIDTLRETCGLVPESFVADVGSGTGLLARLFLDFGCHVYGVEPNPEMRAAGERLLAHYRHFTSLDGSAEQTGLPTAAVEFVTAGQAFHWFAPDLAREEFRRILRPGGWAALVWNERQVDTTPFLREYEQMLYTYGTDYAQVDHRNVENDTTTLEAFFGGPYQVAQYENLQVFDFEGVKGRLMSSSYVPQPGEANHAALLDALRTIFDRYQEDGTIAMYYTTRMFYGRLAG